MLSDNKKAAIYVENPKDFLAKESPYLSIFENMLDGVSVLDINLNIKFVNNAMKKWYTNGVLNHKCYEIYHEVKSPCEWCPAQNTIKTKQTQESTTRYLHKGVNKGWQQIFTVPVFTEKEEICYIIEYVKDVTFQKEMHIMAQNLENRLNDLEKQNEILLSLIKQKDNYREELEETIISNIEQFVKPSLNSLRKNTNSGDIDLINSILDEVVNPHLKNRPTNMGILTPRERQIAWLIKEGVSSKEIATQLFITQKAVDFHRVNIRKKLNLKRTENLQVYLCNNMK